MCVRACVCVCHNEKKLPDEWQARQATPAILQVSSSKHNAKKITTRERGPFHQSITAMCVCERKDNRAPCRRLLSDINTQPGVWDRACVGQCASMSLHV